MRPIRLVQEYNPMTGTTIYIIEERIAFFWWEPIVFQTLRANAEALFERIKKGRAPTRVILNDSRIRT